MGYQYKDTCYATQQQAIDAHFQSQPISFQSSFGESFSNTDFYYYQKYESQWNVCKQNTNANEASNCVHIENPTFSECTDHSDPTSQFITGLELGAAVAGVCVIAFIWRYLRVRF
jgi:hypothetical protein